MTSKSSLIRHLVTWTTLPLEPIEQPDKLRFNRNIFTLFFMFRRIRVVLRRRRGVTTSTDPTASSQHLTLTRADADPINHQSMTSDLHQSQLKPEEANNPASYHVSVPIKRDLDATRTIENIKDGIRQIRMDAEARRIRESRAAVARGGKAHGVLSSESTKAKAVRLLWEQQSLMRDLREVFRGKAKEYAARSSSVFGPELNRESNALLVRRLGDGLRKRENRTALLQEPKDAQLCKQALVKAAEDGMLSDEELVRSVSAGIVDVEDLVDELLFADEGESGWEAGEFSDDKISDAPSVVGKHSVEGAFVAMGEMYPRPLLEGVAELRRITTADLGAVTDDEAVALAKLQKNDPSAFSEEDITRVQSLEEEYKLPKNELRVNRVLQRAAELSPDVQHSLSVLQRVREQCAADEGFQKAMYTVNADFETKYSEMKKRLRPIMRQRAADVPMFFNSRYGSPPPSARPPMDHKMPLGKRESKIISAAKRRESRKKKFQVDPRREHDPSYQAEKAGDSITGRLGRYGLKGIGRKSKMHEKLNWKRTKLHQRIDSADAAATDERRMVRQ